MRPVTLPLALALGMLVVLVAGCGEAISDKYVIEHEPATLEEIPGSPLKKVILEDRAVERLAIQTATVESNGEGLVLPSSALWMDIEGVFWVYTNPEPNAYVRQAVEVVHDDGYRVLVASGPPPGTAVVVAGVAELFGTEVGVGK